MAVVEQKSFAQAAQSVHITPSAVSQTIAKLEQEHGLCLFSRDRNGASLTKDGERLLPFVRAVLDADQRLNQEVTAIKGLETGSVCVGAFNSVCANWIPDIALSFKQTYPNIELRISQGGYQEILEWLRSGKADMGFLALSVAHTEENDFVPLYRDRMMCVTHKDFQPKSAEYITIDEIRSIDMVIHRNGYDSEIAAILKDFGLAENKLFSLENADSIVAMIERGFGVCLLPELALKRISQNISAYPLEPPVYRTIGLVTAKHRSISAAAVRLRDHILAYLQSNQIMNV